MEEIIQKLRDIRLEKGLSLSEVARRMGTVYPRLSEIEHGRGGLTLKNLFRWADAMGVKVEIKLEEK